MDKTLVNKFLDTIELFISYIDVEEIKLKQELWDVVDALESGSVTIDKALFWEQ